MARTKNLVKTTTTTAAVPVNEFPVESLLQEWLASLDVSEVTKKSYRSASKVFVDYLLTWRVPIDETTLREYRDWLKMHRAVSSAKNYFTVAKIFVAWCARRGYCRTNYGEGVKGVKLDTSQHARDALTAEEAARVIAYYDGDDIQSVRNKAIMALLICCGLRTIELVRLDVGDIEQRRGVWMLRVWGKARDGKTDSVALPAEVKALIDRYLMLRKKTSANSPLFVSGSRRNKDERLQTQTISRLAKKTFRAVGIDSARVVCHSCRHAMASIALDHGADIDSVSKTLRHRSIATTEIYRHDDQLFRNTTTQIVADVIFSTIAGAASNR